MAQPSTNKQDDRMADVGVDVDASATGAPELDVESGADDAGGEKKDQGTESVALPGVVDVASAAPSGMADDVELKGDQRESLKDVIRDYLDGGPDQHVQEMVQKLQVAGVHSRKLLLKMSKDTLTILLGPVFGSILYDAMHDSGGGNGGGTIARFPRVVYVKRSRIGASSSDSKEHSPHNRSSSAGEKRPRDSKATTSDAATAEAFWPFREEDLDTVALQALTRRAQQKGAAVPEGDIWLCGADFTRLIPAVTVRELVNSGFPVVYVAASEEDIRVLKRKRFCPWNGTGLGPGQELGVRADTGTAVVVQQVLHVGRSHVVARTSWAGEEAVIRAGWSEQVHRERAALADLQHVNGVPKLLWLGDIYAFGVAVPALVRTFIPGVSLQEFRGCEERRVADIVDSLRRNLEAMHAVGYVHGDVKPSNVVVTSKGDAVFVDLGSASIQGTHRGPATRGFCRGSNRRSAIVDDLYGLDMTQSWLRRKTEADADPGIH